jgi:large subunit ribosomal protein L25
MKAISLKAEKREVFGRKVKKLRRNGKTPGNIYGKKIKSESIDFDSKEFRDVYKEAGETNLIEIVIGKDKHPVLVHETQRHPVTGDVLHVDFFEVNLTEKVTANVPVEVVGDSPAEKQGLGAVVKHIDEVEVECLPSDIPDLFEVNVSGLTDIGQMIQVKDIKVDNKVVIKDDPEGIVVKIDPLTKIEETPVVVAPAEGEEVVASEPVESQAPDVSSTKEESPGKK